MKLALFCDEEQSLFEIVFDQWGKETVERNSVFPWGTMHTLLSYQILMLFIVFELFCTTLQIAGG